MNSVEPSLSRPALMLHLLRWELRRLRLQMVLWMIAALTGTLLVHFAEWPWPEYQANPALQEELSRRMTIAASGVMVAAAMVVYLTGELFVPLGPWTVKSRYARPPRRTDTLVAAMLLHVFLVALPFVSYLFAVNLTTPTGAPADVFVRHYLIMLCATMACMVLAALLTGEWALFVPLSAFLLILPASLNRMLPLYPMVLIFVISLAAMLAAMCWRRRWTVLTVWLIAAVAVLAIPLIQRD